VAVLVDYSVVTVVDLACDATLPAPVEHGSCSNASTRLSNSLFEFNIKARMFIHFLRLCFVFLVFTQKWICLMVCYGQDKVGCHLRLSHCFLFHTWDRQTIVIEYG